MKLLRHMALCILAILWLVPSYAFAVMPPVTNFAKVIVSAGYDSTATSVVLVSGNGARLPTTFPFPLVWWNCTEYGAPEDDPAVEIVSVTNRTTDTLTVVRAQDGTSAQNHNTGSTTYCMVLAITKAMWDAVRADIAAAAGGGSLVLSGTGSPEGIVTAAIGTLFLRTDGAAGTTVYTKISGAGNTGWLAIPVTTDWGSPGFIGSVTPGDSLFTLIYADRIANGFPWPTYGASIAIDAVLGNSFQVVATDNTPFTIQNPTSPTYGQKISIMVKNTSGGALGTITWDTHYKYAAFLNPAAGKRRTITFLYDGTSWVEISCSPEVPN